MLIHTDSKRGLRKSNEDEAIIMINLNRQHKDLKPFNLFCVFDGHGGGMVSKYLKANFAQYIMPTCIPDKMFSTFQAFKRYITTVYDTLQTKLCTQHKSIAEHCGSTAVVVLHLIVKNKPMLYVVNIGDSRAVASNQYNIAIPLTKDHKPQVFEERKRLELLIKKFPESKGKIEFDEGDWRIQDLAMSRAFGDMDTMPFVTHVPNVYRYHATHYNFVIVACDGLWDVVDNQDAVNFVLENDIDDHKGHTILFNKRNNNNIAHLLAAHAIKMGSGDNLTVIVVFLE